MKECKYADRCGGCTYMNSDYESQLKKKQELVEKLMGHYCRVSPIVPMNNPYNYRNKVHGVISSDKKGNIISGTYEPGSHRVVAVDSCRIDNEVADKIIATIVKLMKSFKYTAYNEDTHRGFLRHVLVRFAHSTGQYMVVLVTGDTVFPSKNNFVKALLKEHPQVTTIVQNINNHNTSMVLGDKEFVLYGKGYIEDVLCGKHFRLSAKSFYQVNSVQTELLYDIAVKSANFSGNENIIDAYSGIGTIGIIAASHVKSVTGVELNPQAVRDAGYNARLNGCGNVKYLQGDAGEFMLQEAAAGKKYDVVIMDPPRTGSDEKFLSSLVKLTPDKIIYISCGPKTLARDVKFLTQKGYKVKKCVPVDMFPWAEHVETCVLLTKTSEA